MASHRKCFVCKKSPADRAHIKSRGAGGGLDHENIILLCRDHHMLSHSLGWRSFCDKFPGVEVELNSRGFVFEQIFGFWKLVKYDADSINS